ncbi:Crp/Fnr family transcriptional regulator [Lewinella sp. IMCC34183]|uniref:Crp/Fnr family transcriptional regulator n=1 Tax=Lewinella sp. IMCC34183 TaxID=2248762 RepID=UPI000E2649DB|nr:Crp/Fnr family transcriptional regulator [Lewinella sp. IMCC34183]
MTEASRHALITHLRELIPLADADGTRAAAYFTEERVPRRAVLLHAGRPVRYCYFVVSGLLKLVYTDTAGNQHTVSFAAEQWWESDFGAYFGRGPAAFSLRALEETTVLRLSLDDYWALCAEVPALERFMLHKAHAGFIGAQRRILSLLTSSAAERYTQLLDRQPDLLQRVSKTQLAAYLGVSRETLSRLPRRGK